VALKKLFIHTKNKNSKNMILREIDILRRIDHPNVIKLIDYKIKETSATLVLEYLDYDLYSFIDKSSYPLNNNIIKYILY
jgi:serine/threonine-protein kinase ULK2